MFNRRPQILHLCVLVYHIDTVEKPLISFLKNTVGVPDFYGKPTDIKDNYCITPEIRRKNN
jgi:hypothetical protein